MRMRKTTCICFGMIGLSLLLTSCVTRRNLEESGDLNLRLVQNHQVKLWGSAWEESGALAVAGSVRPRHPGAGPRGISIARFVSGTAMSSLHSSSSSAVSKPGNGRRTTSNSPRPLLRYLRSILPFASNGMPGLIAASKPLVYAPVDNRHCLAVARILRH